VNSHAAAGGRWRNQTLNNMCTVDALVGNNDGRIVFACTQPVVFRRGSRVRREKQQRGWRGAAPRLMVSGQCSSSPPQHSYPSGFPFQHQVCYFRVRPNICPNLLIIAFLSCFCFARPCTVSTDVITSYQDPLTKQADKHYTPLMGGALTA